MGLSSRIFSIFMCYKQQLSFIRPKKKYPVFRATQPYLLELADPGLFFNENTVFFVGVFIIGVSILKKKQKPEPTLPKVFKTVA